MSDVRCETCGKALVKDPQGVWRTILGNLGRGHDHKPVER